MALHEDITVRFIFLSSHRRIKRFYGSKKVLTAGSGLVHMCLTNVDGVFITKSGHNHRKVII